MKIEYTDKDFWKNYMINWFGAELITKWENIVEVKKLNSINGQINIEIYKNLDLSKPTIIFSHETGCKSYFID